MQYLYCIIFLKGDEIMKKRVTFTLEEELIEKLKETSEKTMIPQSKLVEKAIKEVVDEYDHD
jgi:metal-responsive CopG/Arc/MetJ family transcriptional regulator